MESIDNIYKMLHWQNPVEVQLQGMELARTLHDLSLLIQPLADISTWESCAEILYEKKDETLEPYLKKLIEWIQDLNWAGAMTILDRLKVFDGKKLKIPFMKFVEDAIKLNNEEGLKWLDNLSELLDNEELKAALPSEIVILLQKHYHNCAWWYEE